MNSINPEPEALEICVTVKNVYGRDLVYPDCWQSRLFAKIAGTDTLTPQCLASITALGYAIDVKPRPYQPAELGGVG